MTQSQQEQSFRLRVVHAVPWKTAALSELHVQQDSVRNSRNRPANSPLARVHLLAARVQVRVILVASHASLAINSAAIIVTAREPEIPAQIMFGLVPVAIK